MTNPDLLRRALLLFSAFAVAAVLDLGTKWLILEGAMQPPRTVALAPFLNLTLSFNTGVSFGMFRDVFLDRPWLLAAVQAVIAAGLLVWALRTDKTLEAFGLGLIAGGAVGNALDRAWHGGVTDFLDFHLGGWHWYTFNMADVAITIGVFLLIAGAFWPALPSMSGQAHPREAGR